MNTGFFFILMSNTVDIRSWMIEPDDLVVGQVVKFVQVKLGFQS